MVMGHPYRLLIVDDDQILRRALVRDLSSQPYEITAAATAEEAMPLLSSLHPEVIVTDFQMPGSSGTELLMHARSVLPHSGRILITGTPSLQVAMDAINVGAVSRLFIKPFPPALLSQAIREEMDRIETSRLTDRLLRKAKDQQAELDQLRAHVAPGLAAHRASEGGGRSDESRLHDTQEILRRLRQVVS